MELSAQLSACGRYRYLLRRRWAAAGEVLFVMLNPSTADAARDDPTVTRCLKRAQAMGFGGLAVANLFAWRSTDPSALRRVADPVGPGNEAALARAAAGAAMVICAWGECGGLMSRGEVVAARLSAQGLGLWHLGLTSGGQPRHPLYVGYSVAPRPWDQAACSAM